jgi:hypothetical protein
MRARCSSYGRGAGPYIRAQSGAAKIFGWVGDARGQIRVGPDHGPDVTLTAARRSQGGVNTRPVAVGSKMGGGPMTSLVPSH